MTDKVKKESKRKIRKLIKKIHNPDVRMAVDDALRLVPEYFWSVPASTSGEWHPPDERGSGGKVLHVCRVVKLLEAFIEMYDIPTVHADVLIAAGILHDSFFCGFEGRERRKKGRLRSDFLHMYYPAAVFSTLYDKYPYMTEVVKVISLSHGKWSPLPIMYSGEETNTLGWILHMADNIAAQEWFTIDVD